MAVGINSEITARTDNRHEIVLLFIYMSISGQMYRIISGWVLYETKFKQPKNTPLCDSIVFNSIH